MDDDRPECAMRDCLLSPSKMAYVKLRARSSPRDVASAPLGVEFCGGCALNVKRLDDLMDDETWETICRGFEAAGKERPSRELCELEMRDIPRVLLP